MIDHTAIAQDLLERKMNQLEIAKKYNCAPSTVVRIARSIGFNIGRGVKNFWEFTESSPELAYLIGVYLTDGWVHDKKGFNHASVSIEYIAKTEDCLRACGISVGSRGVKHPTNPRHQTQYIACSYSVMFARWLKAECAGKSKVPDFLWNAPIEHRVSFLTAAIDGDGHVTQSGTIQLRGKDHWLFDLEKMLPAMSIRSKGVKVNEILPSGMPYYRININRIDFRALTPQLAIPFKQDRLLNAQDKRQGRIRKLYPCPMCGSVSMQSKHGNQCRECYLKSDEFHQHLIDISPIGGKAGNEKRWGHKS